MLCQMTFNLVTRIISTAAVGDMGERERVCERDPVWGHGLDPSQWQYLTVICYLKASVDLATALKAKVTCICVLEFPGGTSWI